MSAVSMIITPRNVPAAFFLSIPFPTQFNAAVTTVGSEKPRTRFTVFSIHGFSSSNSLLESDIFNQPVNFNYLACICTGKREEKTINMLYQSTVSKSPCPKKLSLPRQREGTNSWRDFLWVTLSKLDSNLWPSQGTASWPDCWPGWWFLWCKHLTICH